MATMVTVCAVLERLEDWFDEHEQSLLKSRKCVDILQRWKAILAYSIHKYLEDECLREEISKLLKILYRIENLVESNELGVASSTSKGIMKIISDYKAREIFRAELRRLTDKMNGCFLDLERCGLREPSLTDRSSSLENYLGRHLTSIGGSYSFNDDDVIRTDQWDEEEAKELVSALIGESRKLQVISICGMGGSGKTTLAWTICNRPEVTNHFPVIAWVAVTQNFQAREIFEDILHMVEGGDLSILELNNEMDLALAVYNHLKGQRWLVVLDDIWSIEAWESIRIAFPLSEKCGARILVTTRNRDIAVSISGDEYVHDLRLFDERQSWELFKRITHLGDAELNPEQEQIARKLLRQSRGLPLAIVVLANMLKSKSVDKWESLDLYGDAEISGSLSFNAVTRTLELSYNSLPVYLMPCLLYMGNFPEGSKIEADKLCQLWIAEGLVSGKKCRGGETLMDVARHYFDELAARNMVQVAEDEMSKNQSFKYGSLHDLIRDICIERANEEGFFDIVMPGSENLTTGSVYRHAIYLDKNGDTANSAPYNLGLKLRTILFFNSIQESGDEELLMVRPREIYDLRNLKWVRVLHFDGVDFKSGIPLGIGNLVLMRYLSFRDCYLEKLPSSISKLLFLITLDLRVRKRCRPTIPNVLFKLERLRHLYLPLKFQTVNHDKLLLDGMKELEILENFDTRTCIAGEIFMLTSFRNLVVIADGNLKDLKQIFKCIEGNGDHLNKTSLGIRNFDSYSSERLSFVQKLFSCRVLDILQLEGRIGKMPEVDTISPRFTEIRLNGSQLEDDPMQTLEKLPNLRILVLEVEAYIGRVMHCSCHGFRELRSLKLSKLYNLESWTMEQEAMPKLSTLSIESCRRMKKFPKGLKYINTLRKLKINMMPKEFVGRLREVYGRDGECHCKINSKCTIQFGSDNPWPEFTDSATEQNNSSEGRILESQISSSAETPDLATSSACPPKNEPDRDVYLQ